jgi:hypothetical protein
MAKEKSSFTGPRVFSPTALYLLAAMAMAYGWGWRGSYGHESGAMVPGALLGMAICLASGRKDWYRRTAVAGMFGAIGWAWGGTLTNMEHRLYILTDTPIDVTYGFFGVALVGMLWSGVGAGILALAFTRSRSELNQYIGPILVIGTTFCLTYVFFFLNPNVRQAYGEYTDALWHDGEWLAALQILIVMIFYWFARPKDRVASTLILQCTVAWWVGYLVFIKWLEIYLAPPDRSEIWAGMVAVQLALLWHHYRHNDRAALMLTLYAMVTGAVAFIIALQLHVPFARDWWIFKSLSAWKVAEEAFGFFMGLGVALGAGRLLRNNVASPDEDADVRPLDVLSVLVVLIVIQWMTIKLNVSDWGSRYKVLPTEPLALFDIPFTQFYAWQWFFVAGVLYTGAALYALRLHLQGRLPLVPASAWGKGSLIFLALMTIGLAAAISKKTPVYASTSSVSAGLSFLLLSGITTWLLFARAPEAVVAPDHPPTSTPTNDAKWRVGWRHLLAWGWVPIHIVLAAQIALPMQEGHWIRPDRANDKERHRFGPRATYQPEMQEHYARERHKFKVENKEQELRELNAQIESVQSDLNNLRENAPD